MNNSWFTERIPFQSAGLRHRPLRFLSYEGTVQKGTGRVRIIDQGNCNLGEQREDLLTFKLSGAVLQGSFALKRDEGTLWQLIPRGL